MLFRVAVHDRIAERRAQVAGLGTSESVGLPFGGARMPGDLFRLTKNSCTTLQSDSAPRVSRSSPDRTHRQIAQYGLHRHRVAGGHVLIVVRVVLEARLTQLDRVAHDPVPGSGRWPDPAQRRLGRIDAIAVRRSKARHRRLGGWFTITTGPMAGTLGFSAGPNQSLEDARPRPRPIRR